MNERKDRSSIEAEARQIAMECADTHHYFMRFFDGAPVDDQYARELELLLGVNQSLTGTISFEVDPDRTANLLALMASKGDRAAFDLCKRLIRYSLLWSAPLPIALSRVAIDLIEGKLKRPRPKGRKLDGFLWRDEAIADLHSQLVTRFPELPKERHPDANPEGVSITRIVAEAFGIAEETVRNVTRDQNFVRLRARLQVLEGGTIATDDRLMFIEEMERRFRR